MKLNCYCCGEPIDGQIALVTMSTMPVDRVFIAKPDHVENFDSPQCLLVVPLLS